MNKPLFTIISILSIFISVNISAAANSTTEKPPENQSEQTKSVDKSSDKSVMDTLWPSTKKCNYVDNKQYQPFADITNNFPGVDGLMDKDGCVIVSGATENLIKLLFTSAITVIIILTVINISIAGIRYMTEEAVGKKGEAKKKLTNSLIALALGLASYTILYTVNKQLVQFEFNPKNIDKDGSVDKGLEDTKNTLANISYLSTFLETTNTYGDNILNTNNGINLGNQYGDPNTTPTWDAVTTEGNFSTYAAFGSIKCSGSLCSSSKPTVFGYLDGNGTVGKKGDNGIGNSAWSTKPGCTYDNWNTMSMGVALPQKFWGAAGIPKSEVKYIGIKLYVNGVFKNILPVVDDSQENLDFTFAAAKAYLDPNITNSDNINTKGKNVTFSIIKDYYKTRQKNNIVWIKNTSTFNKRIPCNI